MGERTLMQHGGCRCGATRFTATGAAFSTYAGYLDEQVVWSGAARRIYESSAGVARGFCAACGSPLSYQGHKWTGETHLFIGGFDDPAGLVPTSDVFAEEALDWAPGMERKG